VVRIRKCSFKDSDFFKCYRKLYTGPLNLIIKSKPRFIGYAKYQIHDNISAYFSTRSTNIIRMIKSRRLRLAGHVARMGRRGLHIGCWWESQRERDHWKDQDVSGWTILKYILER
jgi:hypothetical protein